MTKIIALHKFSIVNILDKEYVKIVTGHNNHDGIFQEESTGYVLVNSIISIVDSDFEGNTRVILSSADTEYHVEGMSPVKTAEAFNHAWNVYISEQILLRENNGKTTNRKVSRSKAKPQSQASRCLRRRTA